MAKELLANPTGNPVIDSALSALAKEFSIDFSPENYGDITPIPTDSLALNLWLTIGGLPDGRIIELIGDPGSLKTSLALAIVASRQRWRKLNNIEGKFDLIIDMEHTLTDAMIRGCGVDMKQIIWKRFQAMEPAMQMIVDLPKTGYIHTVLYDSVDANQTIGEIEKNIGESQVGGSSKNMNQAIRQIAKICEDTKTQYLFINQWRTSPSNGGYGDPRVTPGGKALSYYASARFAMGKDNKGHPDVPNAALLKIKCIKSKFSAPIRDELELAFIYGKGFDRVCDIETVAKSLGLLRHSGGPTKVQWTSDTEMVPLLPDLDKGKEAGLSALRNNPILLERLEATCLRASGLPAKDDSYFVELLNDTVIE